MCVEAKLWSLALYKVFSTCYLFVYSRGDTNFFSELHGNWPSLESFMCATFADFTSAQTVSSLGKSDLCHLFPLELPMVLPETIGAEGTCSEILFIQLQLMKMADFHKRIFYFFPVYLTFYQVAFMLRVTTSL